LQNIDPTDPGGQFADRGPQYQTAIFYHNQTQKAQAITALQKLRDSGRFNQPLTVQVLPYKNFYPAEDYHQSYYLKHPLRYQMYKKGSGREEFLARAANKSH
jgi:methionine-S-sulfoxide reductase